MKKYILIFSLLMTTLCFSQRIIRVGGIEYGMLTTSEMNALTGQKASEGVFIWNTDTKTLWSHDGTQWIDTGNQGTTNISLVITDNLDGTQTVVLTDSENNTVQDTFTDADNQDASEVNVDTSGVLTETQLYNPIREKCKRHCRGFGRCLRRIYFKCRVGYYVIGFYRCYFRIQWIG